VLPATRGRGHSSLVPSQLKLVSDLATPEGCEAELTQLAWLTYIARWYTRLKTVTHRSTNKKHLKNVGPIRHNEPPHATSPGVATVLSHAACASMSTTPTKTTTTTRDRGDRYGPMEWAQSGSTQSNFVHATNDDTATTPNTYTHTTHGQIYGYLPGRTASPPTTARRRAQPRVSKWN